MSTSTSPPALAQVWRNRPPGPGEIAALMNMIPDAAILVDRTRACVFFGNSAFLKLTAFTQSELALAALDRLLPGCVLDAGLLDDQSLVLTRRSRSPLSVLARATALDSTRQWLVIVIVPAGQYRVDPFKDMERVYSLYLDLAKLTDQPNQPEALAFALEKTGILFQADYCCVYLPDHNHPRAYRNAVREPAPFFPEFLSSGDFSRLAGPTIWTPGRRMLTELQRAARVADMSFLATYSLGQPNALSGLLVIADKTKQPIPNLEPVMAFAAAQIGRALEYYILLDNLKNQADKLHRSQIIRDGFFVNSREGLLVLDTDFNIIEFNPVAEWMLGYTGDEVNNRPVESILIGTRRLRPALEKACEGVKTPKIGGVRLHRRSGQIFPAELRVLPVMRDNQVFAILVSVEDISENEQIREQSQQLEQRAVIGELTAIFAHDVRAPLNNISTGAQLLATDFASPESRQEAIQIILQECNRLNSMMNSILNLTRPLDPKPVPMNILTTLEMILGRWRPRLARANIQSMLFKSEERLPLIMGDPHLLENVFTNLVSNAFEAMSEKGGTFSFKIQRAAMQGASEQLEILVTDTGPGIPDEMKDKIFKPFTTTKKTGTGLGLAIVKRILTSHQGNIELVQNVGGTVFKVTLPAMEFEERR